MTAGAARLPSPVPAKPQAMEPFSLKVPPVLFVFLFLLLSGALFYLWGREWSQAAFILGLIPEYWQRDARFLIPAWGGFFTTWTGNSLAMLLLAAFEVASWGVGRLALTWALKWMPAGLKGALLALGLGNGLLSMLVLSLGLSGLLQPLLLWPAFAALFGWAWLRAVRDGGGVAGLAASWSKTMAALKSWLWVEWLLLSVCMLIVITNYLWALQPEEFLDSLVYHLADPEQFLLEHKIFYFSDSSNLPFLQEMQYLLLLGLGSDIACKLLHWMDGILCALAVYALARTFLGQRAGLLAMAVFLSQPTLRLLQHVTMVELKLTWFEVLATMAFVGGMGWLKGGEGKVRGGAWFLLVGWFLGFAHGTKYHGIFASVLILGWWSMARGFKAGGAARSRWGELFSILGWASLWTLPWLGKSWLLTGNPFFPLLQNVFPAFNWDEQLYQQWLLANIQYGTGHGNWVNWLLLPVHASVENADFGSYTLNPFALLFLPCMILYRSPPSPQRFFAAYAGLYTVLWAVTSQQTRYLIPMVPQAAVAVAFLITRIGAGAWPVKAVVSAAVTWILVVSTFAQMYNLFTSNRALLPYTMGHMDRGKFLRTYVSYYETVEKANQVVGERDRLLFLRGGETFYCRRRRLRNSIFDRPAIGDLAQRAASAEALVRSLQRLRVTHVLVHNWRIDGLVGLSRTGLSDWGLQARERLLELWAAHLRLLFSSNNVFLFELDLGPLPDHERKLGIPAYFYPQSVLVKAHALMSQVDQLNQQGLQGETYQVTDELVRLLPKTSMAYFYRGYANVQLKKQKEAIADHESAIRLGYPNAVVYYNLGRLLEGERRYKEALKRYREAIALDPTMGDVRDRIVKIRPLAAAVAQKMK